MAAGDVDFEGKRVLVVDDNDTNRRLLRATAAPPLPLRQLRPPEVQQV